MKKAILNRFSYLYKPAMRSSTANHEDVAITVGTLDPSLFVTRGKVTVGIINNGDCVLIRNICFCFMRPLEGDGGFN